MFSDAIYEVLPNPTIDISGAEDIYDVLRQHRLDQMQEDGEAVQHIDLPAPLLQRYEVQIHPSAKTKAMAIRQVKAEDVGHLVRIRGMITRISDVKPLMSVATYTCNSCGNEIYQQVVSRQFNPLTACISAECKTNNSSEQLILQTKASKFVKYQEVRFQELPDQVPMGHIPRTLTVYLRGELTRTCEPGAIVTISGIFLPTPYTAQHQMRVGLITETYLEATYVENHKKRYSAMEVSEELEYQVRQLHEREDLYTVLSQSIAPEIFGHEDVKKALLLLMIGGVTKRMDEGMKIRGDINICLMGDPGVAKSQLLKHISTVAPRGIYTTGKGSSGVGLTAAVVRDTMTHELSLEGGALVLADMGICCIDEFDKMEDSDRTAIHEVMEQQTVSIAKAGITTTLNARTSVLAAANPIYGRYNRKLTPSQNINLPNALLSRFDLMFLILDKANVEQDQLLARHVTYVHRYCKNPAMTFEPVSPAVLRYFIAIAKQFNPIIPVSLSNYLVEAYVTLRQEDARNTLANEQTAMTARQLLSILRMSQALGRMRFATSVTQADVDEAMRLIHISKSSLDDTEERSNKTYQDVNSKIYRLILDHAKSESNGVEYSTIEPIVLRKGFTEKQLRDCLDEYQQIDILHLSENGTRIHFISPN